MEMATMLKIAGAVAGLIGTVLLAVRVTRILDMLVLVAKPQDLHVRAKAAQARGENVPVVAMYGFDKHLDQVQTKSGTKLLASGFALQVAGMALNVASFLV